MSGGPFAHLGLEMRPIVIHDDVQHLLAWIPATNPLQERQELDPGLASRESAVQAIRFHVVESQEVTDAPRASVGGAKSIHTLPWPCPAVSVARLQVQRAKLVDAQ